MIGIRVGPCVNLLVAISSVNRNNNRGGRALVHQGRSSSCILRITIFICNKSTVFQYKFYVYNTLYGAFSKLYKLDHEEI